MKRRENQLSEIRTGLGIIAMGILGLMSPGPAHGQEATPPEVSDPILVTGDRPDLPHSEAHLAVDPTDSRHMVAASIVFPEAEEPRVDAFVTFDGGRSWSRHRLPMAQGLHAFDPWTAIGPEGEVYVSVLGNLGRGRASWLYPAREGGRSWSSPVQLPVGEPRSQDQGKMVVDTTSSEWRGRIYLAIDQWGAHTTSDESTDGLSFYRIDEPASPPPPVAHRVNNLHKTAIRPLVTSDGTVVQLFSSWGRIRNAERTNLIWAMHSMDGGRTFSEPAFVSMDRSRGWVDAAIASAGAHPQRVYASWHWEADGVRRIVLAHSDDLGQRWSDVRTIWEIPDGREAYFQRIETDGLGRVAVSWVEHIPMGEARECHEWFIATSEDGGATFSDPVGLAPRACNDLPGDPVYIDGVGNLDPVLPRFARGGEYHGIVGLPGGGFRVLFPAPLDDVLPLWMVEVAFLEE